MRQVSAAVRPENVPLKQDGIHGFHAGELGLFVVSAEAKFALDGYKAYLSSAIDCFNGWLVCWKVSMHPDCELAVDILEDLVGKIGLFEGRLLVVHTDTGTFYMTDERADACSRGNAAHSMLPKDKSPLTMPVPKAFSARSSLTSFPAWIGLTAHSRSSRAVLTATSSGIV